MQERLLRHRQPKGPVTAMVGLNITAPLLDSTNYEGFQHDQIAVVNQITTADGRGRNGCHHPLANLRLN